MFLAVALACRLGRAEPPVATLLYPLDGAELPAGQEVEVQSVSLSPDGVDWVELWVNGAQVNVQSAGRQEKFTALQRWTPPAPGVYRLEVKAVDANNVASEPSAVTVTVSSTPPSSICTF
ncbi:MAG: hypothetical protein D6796_16035, partial [Caldilineae bacterium]